MLAAYKPNVGLQPRYLTKITRLQIHFLKKKGRHFLRKRSHSQSLYVVKGVIFQRMSRHIDSVNTGELPTSECNQQMKGISTVYER